MPREEARKLGKRQTSKAKSNKKSKPVRSSDIEEWAGLTVAKFFPTEVSDDEEKEAQETNQQFFDLSSDSPRSPPTDKTNKENESSSFTSRVGTHKLMCFISD